MDTGKNNDFGFQYIKGNILKSVTFTFNTDGTPLEKPVNLLLKAAGAVIEGGGAVSCWVRNDHTKKWDHTLVRHGSNAGGIRWVPRDLQVYRDKVTGKERIFLLLGNPGIISGVYDENLNNGHGGIQWDRNLEYPFPFKGSMKTRPLGMTIANNSLYFSEGDSIFRRNDGARPTYTEIFNLHEDSDTDIGGIRGLTTIKNPNGAGESLLFLWAKSKGSTSDIKRLDPLLLGDEQKHIQYKLNDEIRIADLMSQHLGFRIPYTLGAHNMMYPVQHPKTGETVHIIGFQGYLAGIPQEIDAKRWAPSRSYAGALYAVRHQDATYTVHEVNNPYRPGKQALVAPRAFCLSPFADHHIYIGGHDASRHISDNMAWIFNAPLEVALGMIQGTDASPPPAKPKPEPRLLQGPIYELRIYHANEDRFEHLIERFQQHTDRLFRKHNMIPVGYFSRIEGTAKQKRTLVYILKHPSRYDAYLNWNAFNIDRAWEKVIEQPKYKGLLSQKPISIFMTDTGKLKRDLLFEATSSNIFEFSTYTTKAGQLSTLIDHFNNPPKPVTSMLKMYWKPFDKPENKNTLISFISHSNREQTDEDLFKPVDLDNETLHPLNQKLLAKEPERLYLRLLSISNLQ